jgi:hypothetical protein
MADGARVGATEEPADLLSGSSKTIPALARDSSLVEIMVGHARCLPQKDIAGHVRAGKADHQPQVVIS